MEQARAATRLERLFFDPETAAAALRERVYVTLTGLSTVLLLLTTHEQGVVAALSSLVATMGGLWAASLVAEYVAYSTVHGQPAHGTDLRHMVLVSGQALELAVAPLVVVGLSATGLWSLHTGLLVAAGAFVLTQAGVAYLAVQRSTLSGPRRWVVVGFELTLCVLVILLKVALH